jgi:hypothetical protein
MKPGIKHKLYLAWAWCDNEDKSTEFTLQFMSDFANTSYDEVVDFMYESSEEERDVWYINNPRWETEFELLQLKHSLK